MRNFPETLESRPHAYQVAELTSFDEIERFYAAMVRVYGLDNAEILDRQSHFFARDGEGFLYGIQEQGRLIAGVQLMIYNTDNARYAYSQNKFVEKQYEGQGLAQLLEAKEEAAAKSEQCVAIFCFIDPHRVRAVRSAALSGYVRAKADFLPEVQAENPKEMMYVKTLR